MSPLGADHPLDWTSEWAAQRESLPQGWEGDQETEELKEHQGLTPLVSEQHHLSGSTLPPLCSTTCGAGNSSLKLALQAGS